MTEPGMAHVPVMLDEVMAALGPAVGETIVDGTFGAGGYTRAMLDAGADVVAIDRDPSAIAAGRALEVAYAGRLRLIEGRFADMEAHLAGLGIQAVDGVVLDVGVSSMQLDRPERGFSFRFEGPLDMRMGGGSVTAADVVNELSTSALTRLIRLLGEDKAAGRIARAIADARAVAPLRTTQGLTRVIEAAAGPRRHDDIHPATRTFQALRIFVNRELDEIAEALGAAERVLKPGGRLVVVTFHSLEDRIVKRFIAERSREGAGASRHAAAPEQPVPTFKPIHRRPLAPSPEEARANPRARSAKLRAAVRTDAPARAIDKRALGVPHLESIHRELGSWRH